MNSILFFRVVSFLVYSCTHSILGHPDGAPLTDDVCKKMEPFHGEPSMPIQTLPFKVTMNKWFIRGYGRITIKVESTDSSKYTLAGFLFMVKKLNQKDGQGYGTFDTSMMKDDLKTIDCFKNPGSALTHSHNKPKTAISFQWEAPNDTSAMYELHATLVRDFNSYWSDYVHSRKIEVSVNAPANKGLNLASNYSMVLAALATLLHLIFHVNWPHNLWK